MPSCTARRQRACRQRGVTPALGNLPPKPPAGSGGTPLCTARLLAGTPPSPSPSLPWPYDSLRCHRCCCCRLWSHAPRHLPRPCCPLLRLRPLLQQHQPPPQRDPCHHHWTETLPAAPGRLWGGPLRVAAASTGCPHPPAGVEGGHVVVWGAAASTCGRAMQGVRQWRETR